MREESGTREESEFEAFERIHREATEAFNRGEVEAAWGNVPPDFEFFPPADIVERPKDGLLRGPEEISRYMRLIKETFPDWSAEPQEYVDLGDGVYLIHARLTGTGEISGISQTVDRFQVWEVRERVPIRMREFSERAEALAAAGIETEGGQVPSETIRALQTGIEEFVQAFNEGDYERAFAPFREDYEQIFPPGFTQTRVVGRRAIIDFFRGFQEDVSDWHLKPFEYVDAGQGTFVIGFENSGVGRISGIASEMRVWDVIDIDDQGRPWRDRQFTNRDEALATARIEVED